MKRKSIYIKMDFEELVEIVQVIVGFMDDPFEIIRFLNSNRTFRDKFSTNEQTWRFLISYVYDFTYNGPNPRLEFMKIGIKRNYSIDMAFRELPDKYQWIAYMFYFTKNRWLFHANLRILTREQVENSLDIYDPVYIAFENEVLEDTTMEERRKLLDEVIKNGEYLYLYKNHKWINLGPIRDINVQQLFELNDPLDITIRDIYNAPPYDKTFNNILLTIFDDKDLQYLKIDLTPKYKRENEFLPKEWSIFKQAQLELEKKYGISNILSEFFFILHYSYFPLPDLDY